MVLSTNLHSHSLRLVLATEPALTGQSEAVDRIVSELAAIERSEPAPRRQPDRAQARTVDPDNEDFAPGRAPATWPSQVAQYARFELRIDGPARGNPFVEVELRAEVRGPASTVSVPGFYDGDGRFIVRFMPEHLGEYTFLTFSDARPLDGIAGSFSTSERNRDAHGPVRVADTFHFAYADGTRMRPIGTTAYAWTHQGDELEQRTLATLSGTPFNKLRMCVFPKSYLFNENEPVRYPFEGSPEAGFDLQRPDPAYWAHLERRIDQLAERGIEADLILFHAYDRWGFSTMGPDADDRYVKYAVSRLASFANVWWSLANEYDLLADKSTEDWERFAAIVTENDPSRHLLSIHNCGEFYDYSRPWITHSSIQRQDVYKTSENTDAWRTRWGKPVVVDECAYEGNIDQGWGNITGEELTRRFWEGTVRGGYVGHGETYMHPEDELWWAKGGTLHGTSPARIAFLQEVMESGPDTLGPLQTDWDVPRAGVEGQYYLYYFGFSRPTYRRFLLEPAVEYTIDVLDTWAMTITRLDGTHSGRVEIQLPGRQYIAVRFEAVR